MDLTIAAKICGIMSSVILVSLVGIILAYNDEEAPKNCLNRLKGWITLARLRDTGTQDG